MEYLDILNAVMDSHFEAIKTARHELKKHDRRIKLSDNEESEIKNIIASLDYDNTIAGKAYINSDYHAGMSHIEVHDTLALYYLNYPIMKRLSNPIEAIKEDSLNFYILFLQEIELRKRLSLHIGKQHNKANQYSDELVLLFKGHTELIDELVGLDDDNIAKKIIRWANEWDNDGRMKIENPNNNLKYQYAKALKENGIIKCTIRTFRNKL